MFSLPRTEVLLHLVKHKLKSILGNSFVKNRYPKIFPQIFSREVPQGVAYVTPMLSVSVLREENFSLILAHLLTRTYAKSIKDPFDYQGLLYVSLNKQDEIASKG